MVGEAPLSPSLSLPRRQSRRRKSSSSPMVRRSPNTIFSSARSWMTISTHKPPTRQEIINDLIDDRLKISRAKVYGLEVG